jgi:hypothetical protein
MLSTFPRRLRKSTIAFEVIPEKVPIADGGASRDGQRAHYDLLAQRRFRLRFHDSETKSQRLRCFLSICYGMPKKQLLGICELRLQDCG